MPTIQVAGHDVLVDDEDAHLLVGARWSVRKSFDVFYVQRHFLDAGKYAGYESLHRLILAAGAGQIVDHINGNGLDNRRVNLRVCSHTQNMQNRKIHSNNRCGFKGVYFSPCRGVQHWRAQIQANGKKVNLGRFCTAEQASTAYKLASKALHKEFSRAP